MWDPKWIQRDIRSTSRITISPLETVQVSGLTRVRCHTKSVPVKMEVAVWHYSEQALMNLTYTELRPGSSKVGFCVRNVSARSMTFPAKMTIGALNTANIVPPIFSPEIKAN